MTGSIEISTVTKLIQICVNKGQTVSSNRETCIRLTDTFSLVLEMLQDIQSNYHLKTEQERTRVNRLLQRLQVATTAANGQFDRCQSRVFSKRIGNFLQSSSIKNKLGELQQELQTIISTLSLVLQIGKSKDGNSTSPRISLNEDEMPSMDGRSPSSHTLAETTQPPFLTFSGASAYLPYQPPTFPDPRAYLPYQPPTFPDPRAYLPYQPPTFPDPRAYLPYQPPTRYPPVPVMTGELGTSPTGYPVGLGTQFDWYPPEVVMGRAGPMKVSPWAIKPWSSPPMGDSSN